MSDQLTAQTSEGEVQSDEDQVAALLAEEQPQPREGEGESDDAELEIGADKIKVDKRIKEAWDGLQKSTQTKVEEIKVEREKAASAAQQLQLREGIIAEVSVEMARIKVIEEEIEIGRAHV